MIDFIVEIFDFCTCDAAMMCEHIQAEKHMIIDIRNELCSISETDFVL